MKRSLKIILLIFIAVIILSIIIFFLPICIGDTCYMPVKPWETEQPKTPLCDVDWDGDCDEKDILCQYLNNEIESDLNKSNYCQTDSDCDVLILGADYIKFGCYHFINKEVNKKQIYDKMENYTYIQNCTNIINECAPAPEPVCISSKCVYDEGQGG